MNRTTWMRTLMVVLVVVLLVPQQQASACFGCGWFWGRPLLWSGYAWHNAYCTHHVPYASCGVCCGSYAVSDCCGVPVYYDSWAYVAPPAAQTPQPPAPLPPSAQEPAPTAPPAGLDEGLLQPPSGSTTMRDSAVLNVSVPSAARVLVNGLATTSSGGARRYIARQLEGGRTYTFRVSAEMMRDGQQLSETKIVRLTAGQQAELAFSLEAGQRYLPVAHQRPRTQLTVHVPEDAQVWLAGNATTTTGTVRQYATTQLEEGQAWKGYKIVAKVSRDGQTIVREKTIELAAGQPQEVRFDFPQPQVADGEQEGRMLTAVGPLAQAN